MSFILVYDIPREEKTLHRQVQRQLGRLGSEMIQFSVYKLGDVKALIDIAMQIKKSGGDARILEEKFVF